MRKVFVFAFVFFLLITTYLIWGSASQQSEYEKINNYLGEAFALDEDSLSISNMNENIDAYFISDFSSNVHLLLAYKGDIFEYVYLPKEHFLRIYWKSNSYQSIPIITGRIYDENIRRIEIKGVNLENEMKWIQYNNKDYFICISQTLESNPIEIKGYSDENELIYST